MAALACLLPLVACSDEQEWAQTDHATACGRLCMDALAVDASPNDMAVRRGTYSSPAPEQLSYSIVDNATQVATAYTYDQLQAGPVLPVGEYTLKAVYGENKMGTTPYLYYEQAFEIQPVTTTTLTDISVPLACAIVRPEVSSDLLAHYNDGWTLTLADDQGTSLTVTNGIDYFVPSGQDYTLTLTGTNKLGEAKQVSVPITGVEVRNRYIISCQPDLPVFSLPTQPDYNAWSYHLTFTKPTAANISYLAGLTADKILNNLVYEYSADGGSSWTAFTGTSLTGLTKGTTYTFRAKFGGVVSSNAPTLTTETADAVPNGDFEELTQTISVSGMQQGGAYAIVFPSTNYNNEASFSVSEPNGWASINAKTCNTAAANQNTWFVIPSTYATNVSWTSTRGYKGVLPYSETPEAYSGLSAQSGSYAMVVRNVAWDANGTTPSKTNSAATYYCKNTATIANRSAGKLFLGSYSYSGTMETYNEGTAFPSRPIQLSGYYKYKDNQSGETATVKVTLLNGSTEIASASINLGAASSYTAFSLNIPYSNTQLKANSLRIMIASSNYASYNQAEETASIVTTNYNEDRESASRGAELTIDKLSFTYD